MAKGKTREQRKLDDEFYSGVLVALDSVLHGHDQPTIGADIARAVGPRELMNVARRQGYPFMRLLRRMYRSEGLMEGGDRGEKE